jgi:hypothetical protein
MGSDRIPVLDVLVVKQTELGWLCEIHGRPTHLGTLQISPGTMMPREGERGRIYVTEAAAYDLGLMSLQYA